MDGQTDSIVLEEEIDPNYEPTEKEVIEYATWLGMDLEGEKELFWIAREGLKAPLPENWKPCKTTDTDEIYYFNFATGESTWEHPCDDYYRNLYEEHKKKHLRAQNSEETNARKKKEKADVAEILGKSVASKKKKTTSLNADSLSMSKLKVTGKLEATPLSVSSKKLGSLSSMTGVSGALKSLSSQKQLNTLATADGSVRNLFQQPQVLEKSTYEAPKVSAASLFKPPLSSIKDSATQKGALVTTESSADVDSYRKDLDKQKKKLQRKHDEEIQRMNTDQEDSIVMLKEKQEKELDSVHRTHAATLQKLNEEFEEKKNALENETNRNEKILLRERKDHLQRLESETEFMITRKKQELKLTQSKSLADHESEIKILKERWENKKQITQQQILKEKQSLEEQLKGIVDIKKVQTEMEMLQNTKATVEEELDGLKKENSNLKIDAIALKKENDKLRSQNIECQSCAKLSKNCEEWKEKYLVLAAERESEVIVLENHISSLQAQIVTAAEKAQKEYQTLVETSKSDLAALANELEDTKEKFQQQFNNNSAKITPGHVQLEYDESEDRLQRSKQEILELKNELALKNTEFDAMKLEYKHESDNKNIELTKLHEKAELLDEKIKDLIKDRDEALCAKDKAMQNLQSLAVKLKLVEVDKQHVADELNQLRQTTDSTQQAHSKEIKHYENILSQQKDKVDFAVVELHRTQVDNCKQEIDRLKLANTKLAHEKDQQQDLIQKLEGEGRELSIHLQKLQEEKFEQNEKEKQIILKCEELAISLRHYKATITTMQNEVNASSAKLEAKSSKIIELEQKLQQSLREKASDNEVLSDKLGRALQDYDIAQRQLLNLKIYSDQNKALVEENKDLKLKIPQLSETFKTDGKKFLSDIATQSEETSNHKSLLETERLAEYDNIYQKWQASEASLMLLGKESDRLRVKAQNLDAECNALRMESTKSQSEKVVEIRALHQKIDNMKAELQAFAQNYGLIPSDDPQFIQKCLSGFRDKELHLERECAQLKERKVSQDEENMSLRSQLHVLEYEIQDCRMRLKGSEELHNKAMDRIHKLQSQLEDKHNLLLAHQLELVSKSKTVDLEDARDQAETRVRQLEHLLREKEEEVRQQRLHADTHKEVTERQIKSLEFQISLHQNDLNAARNRIQSLEHRNGSLCMENAAEISAAGAPIIHDGHAKDELTTVQLELATESKLEMELQMNELAMQLEISEGRVSVLEDRCKEQTIELEYLRRENDSVRANMKKYSASSLQTLSVTERLHYEHRKRTLKTELTVQLREYKEREEQALLRSKSRLRAKYEAEKDEVVAQMERQREERVQHEAAQTEQLIRQLKKENDLQIHELRKKLKDDLLMSEQAIKLWKKKYKTALLRASKAEKEEAQSKLREVKQSVFDDLPSACKDEPREELTRSHDELISPTMEDSSNRKKHNKIEKWMYRIRNEHLSMKKAMKVLATERETLYRNLELLKEEKKKCRHQFQDKGLINNRMMREMRNMMEENVLHCHDRLQKLRDLEKYIQNRQKYVPMMEKAVDRMSDICACRSPATKKITEEGYESSLDNSFDSEGDDEYASLLKSLKRWYRNLSSDTNGSIEKDELDTERRIHNDNQLTAHNVSYCTDTWNAMHNLPGLSQQYSHCASISRPQIYSSYNSLNPDKASTRFHHIPNTHVTQSRDFATRSDESYKRQIAKWAQNRKRMQKAAINQASWLSKVSEQIQEYNTQSKVDQLQKDATFQCDDD